MNKENVLKVADAIENHSIPKLGFNMGLFYAKREGETDHTGHNCGTVACIAGWAYTVERGKMNRNLVAAENAAYNAAKKWLDLSASEASALFYPRWEVRHSVTTQQAVTVLRNFAETGEVDWSVANV